MIGTAWAADADAGRAACSPIRPSGSPSPSSCSSPWRARSCGRRSRRCSTSVRRPSPRRSADAEQLRAEAHEGQDRGRAHARPGGHRGRRPSSSRPARKPSACRPAPPRTSRPPSRCASSRRSTASPSPRRQATKQVRDTAVDVALVGHPRAAARAGRLGPQRRRWSTRRSPSCRSACTDLSNFGSPAQNQSRATWCPRRKAGAFSWPNFSILAQPGCRKLALQTAGKPTNRGLYPPQRAHLKRRCVGPGSGPRVAPGVAQFPIIGRRSPLKAPSRSLVAASFRAFPTAVGKAGSVVVSPTGQDPRRLHQALLRGPAGGRGQVLPERKRPAREGPAYRKYRPKPAEMSTILLRLQVRGV